MKYWGYKIVIPPLWDAESYTAECQTSLSHLSLMVRHISKDLKQAALSMSLQGFTNSDIYQHTGISERTMRRLRSPNHQPALPSPIEFGRPRTLNAIQVKVHLNLNPCPWSMELIRLAHSSSATPLPTITPTTGAARHDADAHHRGGRCCVLRRFTGTPPVLHDMGPLDMTGMRTTEVQRRRTHELTTTSSRHHTRWNWHRLTPAIIYESYDVW
jgi:hypothetical protein